ncbi:hypothetical protein [Prolixibacter denitrificans]|uniref:Uncharacterized protein n=2 Tax=Prolixibacter denitrificans TaxID=1541063 RepID=A0A2P8CJX9_9BACT|nr:hypothetical protein [Prolixibacter denitrificans]PSK85252.1 hypothetical protein CLV93_101204 [Prolixibacter denitrificans]
MIPEGYILQPRAIDQSDIIHESPVVRELWFYLLRKVNHKDNGKYRRGEGFFNLSGIAEDLHWWVGYRKKKYSKPQLTKSLGRLRERNMVETAKATRGLIVTICKYDYYQDPENYVGNSEGNTKETRKKRQGSTKNNNKEEGNNVRIREIIDFYNETCVSLPPVKALTDKRIQSINARIREHGIDSVKSMLTNASKSTFLSGQNGRNWIADFGWLFKPENFIKVLEGKYDYKKSESEKGFRIGQKLHTNKYQKKLEW